MSSGPPPGLQDPLLRLHSVNIFVRDQERSVRFYVEQLGFHVAYDVRLQAGDRWVAVAPPDGSALLSLIAPDPRSEQHKLIGRSTQVVFITEDVTAKFREWSKRGVRFHTTPRLKRIKYQEQPHIGEPTPATMLGQESPIWGGVFTRFRDIDGNTFSLVSFDEVTHAVEMQRRTMAMKLEREKRAAQELEIAKQVQARLFPQELPPARTLEYAGVCIQARQVGGDYYDFLNLGQDRIGLVVGDIAGKGIAAALLMANLQANFRSQCAIAMGQSRSLLRSVNRLFYENSIESAYATLFFAEYDDQSQCVRYANCGHLPGILLRADKSVERLPSTSTVLGLFRDFDTPIEERKLCGGDTLALYTDGVTECLNDAGVEFGEDRMVEALQKNRDLPPQASLAAMVDELQLFRCEEQHDDITLIVAKCKGH